MTYRKKPGFFKKPGFYGLSRHFLLEKPLHTALVMAVCLGILINVAESTERPTQLSYLQNQVLLDSVTSFELLGGPTYQALPFQSDSHAATLLVKEISRTLPSVWQIRVPEKISPGSFRVNYQLTAANGNTGRLSHIHFPETEIYATLQPLPPRIIEQEEVLIEKTEEAENTNATSSSPPPKRVVEVQRINIIEGGLTISFHPSQIQYAGTYAGTLTIMIHGL